MDCRVTICDCIIVLLCCCCCCCCVFVFQAEDGIRDLVRSRGLGDVYKRQDVADAATDLGARQVLLDPPCRVDEVDRVVVMLLLSLIHI